MEHMAGIGTSRLNGHAHAPDQAPQSQAAPAHAVRVLLLAAEDSHAPVLAAAVPSEWSTSGSGATANGFATPKEGSVR